MGDIGTWLESLALGEYTDQFRANDIDLELLADLTADDLKDLGVMSVGHRRRILTAAQAQAGATPSAAGGSEPTAPSAATTAERRVLTVMFCDLTDSTALSARTDPEDYVEFINRFRAELDAAIRPFAGHIAQYLGDGVMASFGYPVASGYDGERAVAAGLAVTARVRAMEPFGDHRPQVRVGIATGLTVVGTADAGLAVHDDSAIGEIPNLAARLQAIAAPNTVVISDQTRQLIGDLFECDDLGEVELKGIDGRVRAWTVRGRHTTGSRYEALRTARRSAGFVNRVRELRQLVNHLSPPPAGHAAVALLIGDPGMGKSRLAHETLARLGESAEQPLVLQCSPYSVGVPFSPLIYFLLASVGINTFDQPDQAIAKIRVYLSNSGATTGNRVAALADLLGIKSDEPGRLDDLDSAALRAEMMAMLRDVLGAEVRSGKVLVVEDLQWMDPSTAELLESLLPALCPRVLATSHPGLLPAWLADDDALVIELDGLAEAAVDELVAGMADDRVLSPEVASTIAARSDGVPLYVEELARGYLDAIDDPVAESPSPQVPASLSESIIARLDRMEHGRRIASIAAAIGREFPIQILVASSGLPASVVHAGVGELAAAHMIAPGHSRFGEAIRFRHSLVRDAAYQLLVRRERVRLHGRIADTLEGEFPEIARALPHMLAIHRDGASQHERASAEWERAGQQAAARSAYTEAAGYFTNAIESNARVASSPAQRERELALRLARLGALTCSRGFTADRVEAETELVVGLSQQLGATAKLVPAMHARWVQLASRNEIRWACEYGLQILEVANAGSDVDRLFAHRICATSFLFAGDLAEAHVHYQAFLDLYDPARHAEALRVGHSDHATMVLLGLAELHTLRGDRAQADEWRIRAIDSAIASRRHHDQGHTLVFAGCLHPYLMDDHEELARRASELRALVTQHDLPNWAGYADLFEGIAAVQKGRQEAGIRLAGEGVDLLVAAGAFGSWWHLMFAEACIGAEMWSEADEALARAEAPMQRGALAFAAEWHRIRSILAACRDRDPAEAFRLLDVAIDIATTQGAHLLAARAQRTQAALDARSPGAKPW